MTLEELLSREQSRANTDQIVEIISQRPELFYDLWRIFSLNKNPVSRRAAWVIDILTETNNLLQSSHLMAMISMLPSFKADGLKRHSLRMLERNNLPEAKMGELVSLCFQYLENPKESVAVKMFSLKILNKLAQNEPDICSEVIDIIEMQMEESTPGFRSIGKKVIKNLQKVSSTLPNQ
jgi:hypothetical protein